MRNPWNAVIAEALGTFLFFFVGIGAAVASGGNLLAVALAHGIVLAVLVSALGAVSGGHFNPAVTFGVWVADQIPTRRAVSYVLAQCLGGIAAGAAVNLLLSPNAGNLGLPVLAQGVGPLPGLGIEAVLTGVLLIAVFGTAIDPRGPKVGGLMIGFAVAADILMGGPLTGGAMNPARWLASAANLLQYDNFYVWIVGPLVGAGIAALAYRLFFLPEANLAVTPATPAPEATEVRTVVEVQPMADVAEPATRRRSTRTTGTTTRRPSSRDG